MKNLAHKGLKSLKVVISVFGTYKNLTTDTSTNQQYHIIFLRFWQS